MKPPNQAFQRMGQYCDLVEGRRGMETSAEARATLAGLLDHGPLAVMWHEGSGSSRSDFDTVLELRGGASVEAGVLFFYVATQGLSLLQGQRKTLPFM